MKRRDNIDFAVERISNAVKEETNERIMIAMVKLAVNDQMSAMEDYLNKEWNTICMYLDQAENMPKVIRYHAQLDIVNEIYCHFFVGDFDEGFDNISNVIDRLANRKIKEIQKALTIHKLWLFD